METLLIAFVIVSVVSFACYKIAPHIFKVRPSEWISYYFGDPIPPDDVVEEMLQKHREIENGDKDMR